MSGCFEGHRKPCICILPLAFSESLGTGACFSSAFRCAEGLSFKSVMSMGLVHKAPVFHRHCGHHIGFTAAVVYYYKHFTMGNNCQRLDCIDTFLEIMSWNMSALQKTGEFKIIHRYRAEPEARIICPGHSSKSNYFEHRHLDCFNNSYIFLFCYYFQPLWERALLWPFSHLHPGSWI